MRFPIKETVFTVFFLLTISFIGYLQPAQAENTVTFKMVILPAKEISIEDMGLNTFKKSLLTREDENSNNLFMFLDKTWGIYYPLSSI